MSLDKMTLDKISLVKMSLYKMSLDKMFNLTKYQFKKCHVDEITI